TNKTNMKKQLPSFFLLLKNARTKFGLAFCLSLIFSLNTFAQGTWTFAMPTNGTGAATDKANALCADVSGNIYVAGNFGSAASPTVDFDLTIGGTQNRNAAGGGAS